MNSDVENLFQHGLYLHDFIDGWINWTKLNVEYTSIYVDTFLRTASNGHRLGRWDEFYDIWLSTMDRELECELSSNKFTSILKNCMISTIKLRSTCRRLGFPIEHHDVVFYSIKKFLMNIYVNFSTQGFVYYTPSEVEYTLGKTTLRHYKNSESNVTTVGPSVLIVYAQINRFNILDTSYTN